MKTIIIESEPEIKKGRKFKFHGTLKERKLQSQKLIRLQKRKALKS